MRIEFRGSAARRTVVAAAGAYSANMPSATVAIAQLPRRRAAAAPPASAEAALRRRFPNPRGLRVAAADRDDGDAVEQDESRYRVESAAPASGLQHQPAEDRADCRAHAEPSLRPRDGKARSFGGWVSATSVSPPLINAALAAPCSARAARSARSPRASAKATVAAATANNDAASVRRAPNRSVSAPASGASRSCAASFAEKTKDSASARCCRRAAGAAASARDQEEMTSLHSAIPTASPGRRLRRRRAQRLRRALDWLSWVVMRRMLFAAAVFRKCAA